MPLDTVTCDCCSLEVKMYCKSCNLKFCAACGGKHVAENITGGHSIVAYSERYAEPVLPNCKDHSSACTSLCADCKTEVCAKCIIESHEDHQCTDLLKESIKRRQTIQRDTTELEISIIKTLQNLFDEMLKKKERFPEHCEPLISAVKNQGAKLHGIVDIIVERKLAELNDITQKETKVLEKNIEEISSLLGEAISLDEKLRKSLRENFATGFLRFELDLEKFDSLDLSDANLPDFIPKSIDEEPIANMFGDLKICGVKSHKKISIRKSTDFRRETSTSHVVVGTIKSGLGPASLVARVSSEEVWVARRSTLRRMNTKNEILEEVILSDGIALDICLLLNKYVVHSNNYMKMINVYRNGHIDTLIKLAKWSPFGICATSSGDLLVCLRTDIGHQGKVVRFSGSNVTQEIQYATENKPLFSKMASVLFVGENKNSDICVSDPGGNAVVVVNKSGNLRFRYPGQEMFECFTPYGIVTDTMSQILVADRDNDSIHIIDCDGEFLRFIKGSGLYQPFSLSITKNNLLLVSSGTEDKISIVQYTD